LPSSQISDTMSLAQEPDSGVVPGGMPMKVAPMGDVRNNFGRYLVACEDGPVFVTRNGRITAVIEHIEDAEIVAVHGVFFLTDPPAARGAV
jgi:hypothetical protein